MTNGFNQRTKPSNIKTDLKTILKMGLGKYLDVAYQHVFILQFTREPSYFATYHQNYEIYL